MKVLHILMPSLAAAALCISSCTMEDVEFDEQNPTVSAACQGPVIYGADIPDEDLIPGEMMMKFSEESAALLESFSAEDGKLDEDCIRASGMDWLLSSGVTGMERLFPDAGRFEARTRAEGLHLWYKVAMDKSVPTTRAVERFSGAEGVSVIEFSPKMSVSGTPHAVPGPEVVPEQNDIDAPFNDPNLARQWHYRNRGVGSYYAKGCDINVYDVWASFTAGRPDVIVAVVDGGIDYSHEDLAANMWLNPERSGDERYGYNFVDHNYRLTVDEHGTHVAGTVAAVNNNGKGVCGVAGGDAAAGRPGVRLMSCQMFKTLPDGTSLSGDGAAAIKWGADHGAVISQNSWGYEGARSTPQSTKDAIDYFIKYAGVDEHGRQVGPMKGGVVIFSAGNSSMPYGHPASYEPVVAVTAVGADFCAAYYTNYGDWADIAAPGGDTQKGPEVYSTLPGNKYGYMQGTSMACPHVSGVAALIVSYFGGEGFTNDKLKKLLLENVRDISSYNKKYLGSGLVNAFKAIAGSGYPPVIILDENDLTLANFEMRYLGYTVSDPDGETCEVKLVGAHNGVRIDPSGVGDRIAIDALKHDAGKYSFKMIATDESGLADTAQVRYTVKANTPPRIVKPIPDVVINGLDSGAREVKITDCFTDDDGEALSYSVSAPDFVKASVVSNGNLVISGIGYGTGEVAVTASDHRKASVTQKFRILVRDGSSELDTYPNPVSDRLFIRAGEDARIEYRLVNGMGSTVYSGISDVTPFAPLSLEMKGLPAGVYTIIVSFDGKELKRNIVKI